MIAVAKQARALGAFAEWQPRYAQHGIATFPVVIDGSGKRPAVKGYLKVGSDLSRHLALRFAANDAFGFALGRYNRITVLDVDTRDDRVLSEALAKHGPSPLIIRSGSGNWQAWYRHGGEGRHVRPWGRDLPIDVLGGGYVVAPPSAGTRGRYEIVQGSLDVSSGSPRCKPSTSSSPRPRRLQRPQKRRQRPFVMASGTTAFGAPACAMRFAGRTSTSCSTSPALTMRRSSWSPLAEAEVVRIAGSAGSYTEKGENSSATRGPVGLPRTAVDELASTDPHAFALFGLLRCWHGDRDRFVLAKGTAKGQMDPSDVQGRPAAAGRGGPI